ncbi:Protein kinase-like domain superfamily protein [Pleurotus pulmonarius]
MSSDGSVGTLDDSLIDSWYWNAIVPPPVHFEDYKVLKRLHQTPSSKVFLVTETETDDRYILKVVDKAACSEAQLSRTLDEQWLLGRVCANVQFTSLVRSWHDRKHFYFILVYYPRTLADTLCGPAFDVCRPRVYAIGIFSALQVLHEHHVIHRDLNTFNVFLREDGQVVLGGLARCKIFSKDTKGDKLDENSFSTVDDETLSASDMVEYMSPERLAGEPYSFEADLWSVGVILYRMAVGQLPFRGNTIDEVRRSISEDELVFPEEKDIDRATEDFIRRLLCPDISQRMTDIETIKWHPYFRFTDWDSIAKRKTISPWRPWTSSYPALRHPRSYIEITPGDPYDEDDDPYPDFTCDNAAPPHPYTESLYPEAYRNLPSTFFGPLCASPRSISSGGFSAFTSQRMVEC